MKNSINVEDLRFFCIRHIPSRKYVITNKSKCYWESISAAKTAFTYHFGEQFDRVRNTNGKAEFRIKEFRLTEVPQKNIEFSKLYAKKVKEFLK